MSIPAAIQELVERFQNNRDAYRSAAYNEAQCRQEFINPYALYGLTEDEIKIVRGEYNS